MEEIPIQFEHAGKKYIGHYDKVAGAGSSSVWHLMDLNNYYLGRLRIGPKNEWVFDESKPVDKLFELADFFGDYITAWIE